MNLLDVPFLFRDTAHAHKTLDGKVGDDLKASLEGKGLKVLVKRRTKTLIGAL